MREDLIKSAILYKKMSEYLKKYHFRLSFGEKLYLFDVMKALRIDGLPLTFAIGYYRLKNYDFAAFVNLVYNLSKYLTTGKFTLEPIPKQYLDRIILQDKLSECTADLYGCVELTGEYADDIVSDNK